MSSASHNEEVDCVTAVDYVNTQSQLEKEAIEMMPYDPKECTFTKGPTRQPVFACLTCSRLNDDNPVGVCYSCSIQCHSTHDIVELFAKRDFVCDCGTTRMAKTTNGACKLRIREQESNSSIRPRTGSFDAPTHWKHELEHAAEDIPSSSNIYTQNFEGLFCSCLKPYNHLEETGTMIQCFFGFECGEEWYHDRCILGYGPDITKESSSSGNLLEKLSPPGDDAETDNQTQVGSKTTDESVFGFPDTNDFDLFVCWKCTKAFPDIFKILCDDKDITLCILPHFDYVSSIDDWKAKYKFFINEIESTDEHKSKKLKVDDKKVTPYSVFFKPNFKNKLLELRSSLSKSSKLHEFLLNYEFLYKEDPIFMEPEEFDDESSNTSLLQLGSNALLSLPREKAIEGLQAYDKMRTKLRDFFKPFAEEGRVVTEEEVRNFFSDVKENADE
ncbi:uncharacterized protein PRCAT00001724001 [Priceomyces carsonii]|uniref:uncharacterized protein n=1 Tax=Priceomyces carsonii TaxID=28549 RepID=UPI002ED965CD|nr:unnamed protein product [Priceomyces carsonii]